MLFIISDASVLIDIEHAELTNAMFNLPWQFAVPDILFFEELAEKYGHLLQLGLISKTMDEEQVAEAYHLRQKFIKTSINDLLALTLAKYENCQLLTGDKALREVAKILDIEVHGTIWLVDKMIQFEKISIETASISFQRMRNAGSRLPWGEVNKLLLKYAEFLRLIEAGEVA